MNDIIEQLELYVERLKASRDLDNLDTFYDALKEMTNYAFEAEVNE
jgi:hypothetical protein